MVVLAYQDHEAYESLTEIDSALKAPYRGLLTPHYDSLMLGQKHS
jgi:hypothetical protein